MTRVRILFFLFGGVGGAERMTLNFGKSLPRDRFDVVFVVCGMQRGILDFIPEGYPVLFIPWSNIYMFPRLRLYNMIRSQRPDYVFASTLQLNIRLLAAASLAKVPAVVRNDNMISYVSDSLRRSMARWYPRAAYVVAQTEEMQEDIRSLTDSAANVVCLHNMLDTETISMSLKDSRNPYSTSGPNYVWTANFLPAKGHDTLIAAFAKVHEKNPASQLYLVGGKLDPEYEHYRRIQGYVEAAGLSECVHFTGFQKNPYVWMKFADCFVLPSRMEGLPNALLEAIYLGTPVVATRCIPVIDRMVEDGLNGYKVPVDDADEMAVAMMKAIDLSNVPLTFSSATGEDIERLFL